MRSTPPEEAWEILAHLPIWKPLFWRPADDLVQVRGPRNVAKALDEGLEVLALDVVPDLAGPHEVAIGVPQPGVEHDQAGDVLRVLHGVEHLALAVPRDALHGARSRSTGLAVARVRDRAAYTARRGTRGARHRARASRAAGPPQSR